VATSGVRLGAVDLNLLVVFDAVMRERSVTRAGRRLGMSQSAMSHALSRLRHLMKDDLFARTPKGMIPTQRAEQLAPDVRAALDNLQRSLEPPHFDPKTAKGTFRIALENYLSFVLVGPLAARLSKNAPGITLDVRPGGNLNVFDLMDERELDLAICALPQDYGKRFSHRMLMRDTFVVVLRKSHPAARKRELSLETLASLSHLDISSGSHRTDFIDEALARHNLKRRIALRAPLISTVRILLQSDMITVFPRRIATEMAQYRPLTIRSLPHPAPILEWSMIWPRWLDKQPSQVWLREAITATVKECPPSPKS
jgi:DNA-binding transcriptional LysR family regulator